MDSERELFCTERLLVRRIDAADFEDLYRVYSDPLAMRYVDDGLPISRSDCERWIDVTAKNYQTRGYGMSALVLRPTRETIGFMGLVHPGGQDEPELKYALLASAWGAGLATEAARGMLQFGQQRFGMHRVIATTAAENTASHRVLEKCGMRILEEPTYEDGSRGRTFVWEALDRSASGIGRPGSQSSKVCPKGGARPTS